MAIVEFQSVTLAHKDQTILTDVNFSVEEGQRLTLIGPSGGGKSSILKLIAGLISPTTGRILFNGQVIDDLDMPTHRQTVSYCFQQPVLFGETVLDNLVFPYIVRSQEPDRATMIEALSRVNLDESFLSKKITEISGGEKQRVALVRNLLGQPKVLLLDEISTGLDSETKEIVHQLLENYLANGHTIIEVTHDQSEIDSAKKILHVQGGRVVR